MGYKITDIVIDRGTIEDESIKKHRKSSAKKTDSPNYTVEPAFESVTADYIEPDSNKSLKKLKLVLFGILSLLLIVFFIVWSINAKALITIETQQAFIEIQDLTIPNFIPIPLSHSISTTTKSVTYQKNERKASGKVTFYNEFSSAPQKLSAQSKIRTQSGLIYKIKDAITIPGYKKSGTKIIPGTVQVSVEAEKIGPSSNVNSGQQLFVSSFQSTSKYNKIYAKSNGITGGVSEKTPVFSEKNTQSFVASTQSISDKAFLDSLTDVKNEPGIYIVYSSSTMVSKTTNACCGQDGSGTTTVTNTATAYRIDKTQILIPLLSKYRLKIKEQISESTEIEADSIDIDVIGGIEKLDLVNNLPTIKKATFRVYTKINSDQLRAYVAGKSINEAIKLIQINSHVRSEITINPLWIRTLPKASELIQIEFK